MAETKIVALRESEVSVETLLAQIADNADTDGLVAVVRLNGCWCTCWSAGVNLGGLSMASLKLTNDVMAEMHRLSPTEGRPSGSGKEL
jgi:hypothetical protein